jgi:hypothetical protein
MLCMWCVTRCPCSCCSAWLAAWLMVKADAVGRTKITVQQLSVARAQRQFGVLRLVHAWAATLTIHLWNATPSSHYAQALPSHAAHIRMTTAQHRLAWSRAQVVTCCSCACAINPVSPRPSSSWCCCSQLWDMCRQLRWQRFGRCHDRHHICCQLPLVQQRHRCSHNRHSLSSITRRRTSTP